MADADADACADAMADQMLGAIDDAFTDLNDDEEIIRAVQQMAMSGTEEQKEEAKELIAQRALSRRMARVLCAWARSVTLLRTWCQCRDAIRPMAPVGRRAAAATTANRSAARLSLHRTTVEPRPTPL